MSDDRRMSDARIAELRALTNDHQAIHFAPHRAAAGLTEALDALEAAEAPRREAADSHRRVALWDAINAFALTKGTSVARQRAVVDVERALEAFTDVAAAVARAEAAEARAADLAGKLSGFRDLARTLDPANLDNDPLETIAGAHIANRNAIGHQRARTDRAEARAAEASSRLSKALGLHYGVPWDQLLVAVSAQRELAERPAPRKPPVSEEYARLRELAVRTPYSLAELIDELETINRWRIAREPAAEGDLRAIALAKETTPCPKHGATTPCALCAVEAGALAKEGT